MGDFCIKCKTQTFSDDFFKWNGIISICLKMNEQLLNSLSGEYVLLCETIYIQFVENTGLTPATYIDSDHKDLSELIENLIDNEEYIVLDLEWDDDIYYESIYPIALFTIATSKGVLIIKKSGNNSPIMQTFLTTIHFI